MNEEDLTESGPEPETPGYPSSALPTQLSSIDVSRLSDPLKM